MISKKRWNGKQRQKEKTELWPSVVQGELGCPEVYYAACQQLQRGEWVHQPIPTPVQFTGSEFRLVQEQTGWFVFGG